MGCDLRGILTSFFLEREKVFRLTGWCQRELALALTVNCPLSCPCVLCPLTCYTAVLV
jgi:hypothetical protein